MEYSRQFAGEGIRVSKEHVFSVIHASISHIRVLSLGCLLGEADIVTDPYPDSPPWTVEHGDGVASCERLRFSKGDLIPTQKNTHVTMV